MAVVAGPEEEVAAGAEALTRYCRSILRCDADAQDAAQGAMVKALAALRAGTRPDHLQGWLFRIAHNEAVSIARARGRQVPTAAPAEPASPGRGRRATDRMAIGGPDAHEAVAARERLRLLVGAIGDLPPRQRQALLRRELDGADDATIARELCTSVGAVQQAVSQARMALRRHRPGWPVVPLPAGLVARAVALLVAAGGAAGGVAGLGALRMLPAPSPAAPPSAPVTASDLGALPAAGTRPTPGAPTSSTPLIIHPPRAGEGKLDDLRVGGSSARRAATRPAVAPAAGGDRAAGPGAAPAPPVASAPTGAPQPGRLPTAAGTPPSPAGREPGAVAPVRGADAPVTQAVAPVVRAVAPVAQAVAPVTQAVTPVAQAAAPVAKTVAPVTRAVTPVAQAVAPVAQAVAPVAEAVAPSADEAAASAAAVAGATRATGEALGRATG